MVKQTNLSTDKHWVLILLFIGGTQAQFSPCFMITQQNIKHNSPTSDYITGNAGIILIMALLSAHMGGHLTNTFQKIWFWYYTDYFT